MLSILRARIRQKYRTVRYPDGDPVLPDRFHGVPEISAACTPSCKACEAICPTGAIKHTGDSASIDCGRCTFCGACERECPVHAVTFTRGWKLAGRTREGLVVSREKSIRMEAMGRELRRLLGRSLRLRQVSAGGCNACEADLNVLGTVVFDLARFGIQFVASPRHADGIVVTGPVTRNMKLALKKTYDAIPDPRIVIASGACAISGGIYADRPETLNGAASVVPVDLFVPGCPPHPYTFLDGVLRLLGRI